MDRISPVKIRDNFWCKRNIPNIKTWMLFESLQGFLSLQEGLPIFDEESTIIILVWEDNRLIPLILLMEWAKRSTASTNRKGEMGHPCLSPLLYWNQPELVPRFIIHDSVDWYQVLIQEMKLFPRLYVSRNRKRKECSKESKAPLKSSDTMSPWRPVS